MADDDQCIYNSGNLSNISLKTTPSLERLPGHKLHSTEQIVFYNARRANIEREQKDLVNNGTRRQKVKPDDESEAQWVAIELEAGRKH